MLTFSAYRVSIAIFSFQNKLHKNIHDVDTQSS